MQRVQTVIRKTADPDTCIKHYQFEIFVRQKLLTSAHYDLLLKKSDAPGIPGGFVEPHFKLFARYSGNVFYADAKYLPRISRPSIEWCNPFEFHRYQELDSATPVYILIGEGPQPVAPRHVFFFPVKNLRTNRILSANIMKYSISATADIDEAYLLKSRLSY